MKNTFGTLHIYVLYLYSLFIITLGLMINCLSLFRKLAGRFSRKGYLLLAILLIFSFLVRLYLVPHEHQVYYDEFQFMNVAQNIYYHGLFGYTLMGDKSHPEEVVFYHRPGGYPFLLNLAFILWGESEHTVYLANIILGSLSIVLFFFVVYLLFRNIYVSFFSALILCLFPIHLKYSCSGASDISSLFFVCFFILVAMLYFRTGEQNLSYFLLALFISSSFIRPDNILLFPFLLSFLCVLFVKKRIEKKLFLNQLYFLIILLLPLFLQLGKMARVEDMNAQGTFWTLGHFIRHLPINLRFIFDYHYNFLSVTIIALIGGIIVYRMDRRLLFILLAWFSFWFIIYSGHFMGGFDPVHYLDADRKFLFCALSISICAGAGICFLFRRLCIFNRFIALILLVSFLTLVGWNSCIVTQRITPQIRHPWERGEYEFLKTLSDKLPNDVYIITPDPGFLISVINKKSIRTDVLLKKRFFPRRLIFFKGVQWEMGARRDADVYKTIEGFLREIYRFEVLERKIFFPGYETTFYNLTLKTPGD